MKVYAIDVRGRATAVFSAEDDQEAEDFVHGRTEEGEAFLEDLTVLEDEGSPLWDGKSEIRMRVASDDEERAWRKSHRSAVVRGDDDARDRDEWLSFLVPISDPTRDA